ncbi:MAG: SGNH/GDSL hydrolase family protein [Candidatus Omnitrophica bacterium]|nr:SGNH/GDSL hydrolase family protein [Candidatus Omnitrophota bacterium]
MKGFYKNIIVCVGSILITMLFLEGVVRLFGLSPDIIDYSGTHWRLSRNAKIVYERTPYAIENGDRINNFGFKDTDFVLTKDQYLVRIVMLGDSITEGVSVRLGKTFSDRLEALLNGKNSSAGPHRYEVMNFGVGGYNIEAEIETLRTKALQFSPDIVILNFYRNDAEPLPGIHNWYNYSFLTEKQRLKVFQRYYNSRNSYLSWFIKNTLSRSHLYQVLMDRFPRLRRRISLAYIFALRHENKDITLQERAILLENMEKLARLRDQYKFNVLICIHPDLLFYDGFPNNRILADIAEELRFPYFFMYRYYQKRVDNPVRLQVNAQDKCHPNELGHQIVAEALYEELGRQGWLR